MTGRGYDPVKRVFDVVVASLVLAVSLPLQVVLAVAVRRDVGSPVLFRQPRPGLDGAVFELRKFRTMRDPDPARGQVSDADRLTRLGVFLRSTSLDELPSLWNVVRGEMSLVGPRPLLVRYLERYSPEQARRHEVRPGITGLAQVSGRNLLAWEDRFACDVEYVDTRSLTLDLRILGLTLVRVVTRQGIDDGVTATATEFTSTELASTELTSTKLTSTAAAGDTERPRR